jgi:lactoylglutathione lyase
MFMEGRLTRVWVATVHVRDLGRALDFYRDVLGLKVRLDARKFKWIELGPDEPYAKIGLSEVSNSELMKKVGVVTGIVFDTDNITKLHQRLSANGVKFTRSPTKTPWGGMVADFLDPDGNEIEVVQDPTHYDQDFPPEGAISLRK